MLSVSEKASAEQLEERWPTLIESRALEELTGFMSSHSNLPGPRANLTLAFEAAEQILGGWRRHEAPLRKLLDMWAHSMDEYLLLCRNIALGYVLSMYDDEVYEEVLYRQNFHPMWRAREAVTLGLQKTLRSRPEYTLGLLEKWNESGDALILRNTIMVLADPPSLRDSYRQPNIANIAHAPLYNRILYPQQLGYSCFHIQPPKLMSLAVSYNKSTKRQYCLRRW